MSKNDLKPKERYKIPRQSMPEQEPGDRVRNFDEVPFGLSIESAVLEARRCLQCKKPLCVGGCPVQIDIPGFINAIAEENFEEAIRVMKGDNLLPAICGRVCPQEEQCEKVCVLSKRMDPVAVGRLERFIADWERGQGIVSIPEIAPPTGKKVAVVGSGPAGITVACDLRKWGHEVTVFEALHELGGVLVYGIPEFRLPKNIVRAEISLLEKMGIKLVTDMVIGKVASLEEMRQEYDSIFLGVGAGLPNFMGIPGENMIGIYSANEYLTRSNLMKAFRFPEYDTPIIKSKKVVTLGAGNVSMDSARTALRLGAEESHIVYRRSRTEMPARIEEIHHAEEEGIIFHLLTNPVRFLGDEQGKVKGMTCLRMELGEPDDSGRRRPVPIEGSEFDIECDTVVVAIGNRANPLIPNVTPDLEVNRWGNIVADPDTLKTSIEGVYAGGDIVLGAATVILAMGHGRQAARAMHEYMLGESAAAAS